MNTQAFILLVIALLMGSSYPLGIEPRFFDPIISIAAIVTAVFISFLVSSLTATMVVRGLLKASKENTSIRMLLFGQIIIVLTLVVLQAVLTYGFHLPHLAVHTFNLGGSIAVAELVIISPLILCIIAAWIPYYRVSIMIRPRSTTLASYLVFQFRQQLLIFIVPMTILFVLMDITGEIALLRHLGELIPVISWGAIAVAGFIFYALAPLFLRIIWSARPLSRGPLRDVLENIGRKAGFKYSDILVWDTKGQRLANACIAGIFPTLRYVILTDYLVENLSPTEVGSVFAHEIGHVKNRHMLLYLLLTFGFLLCLYFFSSTSAMITCQWWGEQIAFLVEMSVVTIVFWVVVFGYLSRRFERQADVFGANLIGDFKVFSATLDKIAILNGSSRRFGGLRHFSVETRIAFLQQLKENPFFFSHYNLSLTLTRLGVYVFVVISLLLGCLAFSKEAEHMKSRAERIRASDFAEMGASLLEEGNPDRAALYLEAALAAGDNSFWTLIYLGDAYIMMDRIKEAREMYLRASLAGPLDPHQLSSLNSRFQRCATPQP